MSSSLNGEGCISLLHYNFPPDDILNYGSRARRITNNPKK